MPNKHVTYPFVASHMLVLVCCCIYPNCCFSKPIAVSLNQLLLSLYQLLLSLYQLLLSLSQLLLSLPQLPSTTTDESSRTAQSKAHWDTPALTAASAAMPDVTEGQRTDRNY